VREKALRGREKESKRESTARERERKSLREREHCERERERVCREKFQSEREDESK
jgi:hypothetical protein